MAKEQPKPKRTLKPMPKKPEPKVYPNETVHQAHVNAGISYSALCEVCTGGS